MKPACAILALLLLAGCTSLSLSDRAYVLCSGYQSALSSLAEHRAAGRLSEAMVARVEDVRPVGTGVCTAPGVTAEGITDLERVLSALIAIENEARP